MLTSRRHLLKGLTLGTGVPEPDDPTGGTATKAQDCIDPELSAKYSRPMFSSLDSHSLKKNHEAIASARSIRGFFARPHVTPGESTHQNAYHFSQPPFPPSPLSFNAGLKALPPKANF
jgi:hypothetical protein